MNSRIIFYTCSCLLFKSLFHKNCVSFYTCSYPSQHFYPPQRSISLEVSYVAIWWFALADVSTCRGNNCRQQTLANDKVSRLVGKTPSLLLCLDSLSTTRTVMRMWSSYILQCTHAYIGVSAFARTNN